MWHTEPRNLTLLNTLGLQAQADHYAPLDDDAHVPSMQTLLADWKGRVFVLGGGSNVVLPQRIDRLVLHVRTQGCRVIDRTANSVLVEAAAGESWHGFVEYCLQQGLPGLENLALIPGTVGAAPVQNIGAYGVELSQRLHSLLAWDIVRGCYVEFSNRDCEFAYRDSVFKRAGQGRWLILRVRFALPRQWQPVLGYPDLQRRLGSLGQVSARQVFDAVCAIRQEKLPDPKVLGNAGSFFKNPVVGSAKLDALRVEWPELVAYPQADGSWKLAAGWLIDKAGWKGYREGPVGIHERQALVLVNYGGASAGDIARLAKCVRDDVRRRFGVELEQEPVQVQP